MSSRADLTAFVLAVFGLFFAGVYAAFFPRAIESNGPSIITFLILTVPIFSYAAYWAFNIRHALAVQLYRRQALGMGILVLAFWITIATFVVVPTYSNFPSSLASLVPQMEDYFAYSLIIIVLYYWIDASVLAARRSDPLLRDTLYWSKIRVPLWIIIIVAISIPSLILTYIGITSNLVALIQLDAGTLGGQVVSFLINDIVFNVTIVVPICGIIYLPLIAMRSKWDKNLRRHFLWFAPVAVVVLLSFFGPLSGLPHSFVTLMISSVMLVTAGYSLYRSTKALVPLNRISSMDVIAK